MKFSDFAPFIAFILFLAVVRFFLMGGPHHPPSGISPSPTVPPASAPGLRQDDSGKTCTHTPISVIAPTPPAAPVLRKDNSGKTRTPTPISVSAPAPPAAPGLRKDDSGKTRTPTPISANAPKPPAAPAVIPARNYSAFVTIGTSAKLGTPWGVRYHKGHLWLTDAVKNSLEKWTTAGARAFGPVSVYGSPAMALNFPQAVGIDPVSGNAYVPDVRYEQIEVFDNQGAFLAVLKNPKLGGAVGAAVNSSGTTVYALSSERVVALFSIGGTASRPVFTYQKTFPVGSRGISSNICLDAGNNIYVADRADQRVTKYTSAGVSIQNFVPPNPSGYFPQDMAVDGTGNVYVSHQGVGWQSSILVFDPSGRVVGQFGAGIKAQPAGITTDGAGNIYVAYNSGLGGIIGFH